MDIHDFGAYESGELAFWQDTVCQNILNVSTEIADRSQPFSGSLWGITRGDLRVASFRSSAHTVMRTRSHLSRTDNQTLMISLQVEGESHIEQADARVRLCSGEIGVLDGGRPFRIAFPDTVRRTIAILPRQRVLMRAPWIARRPALKLSPEAPYAGLVKQHLLELKRMGESSTEAQADMIIDNLCNCLALMNGEATQEEPDLVKAVLAYCRGRLCEVDLCPQMVADHFRISVRTLHLHFQQTGQSFGRWLLASRLEATRQALRDSGRAAQSICEIAYSFGFNDISAFNRAFRRTFDETPRSFRQNPLS